MSGNIEERETLKGKLSQIPSIDKTLSQAGQSADAKVTGDALARKVNVTDIVDNCTTDTANKPLSAKQGAELQRQIDELRALLNG